MMRIGVNNYRLSLGHSKAHRLKALKKLYDLKVKNEALGILIDIPSDMKTLEKIIPNLKINCLEPNCISISLDHDEKQLYLLNEMLKNIVGNIKIIVNVRDKYDIDKIDEILLIFDGIFISRDKLILNYSPKYLPKIQRDLIEKSNNLNKITIISGQFLSNLSKTGIVNRSELSDVALAVRQKVNMLTVNWIEVNNYHAEEAISLMKKIIKVENQMK